MGHHVKGPVLFCTELLLISSGANDGFYLTDKWQKRISAVEEELSQPFADRNVLWLGRMVSAESLSLNDSLESFHGSYYYSESIRNRTLVWAAGFHLYNLLDCYQYLSLSRRDPGHEPGRSPKGALWRSLLVPGWGQLYNKEYSKLGLMVMAVAGFSMNIYVWNKTGNYYSGLKEKYRAISDPLSASLEEVQARKKSLSPALFPDSVDYADSLRSLDTAVARLSNDISFANDRKEGYYGREKTYFSDRNQNIWYLFAVYLYAAFDAYVDAHLSGFERKMEFGLHPRPEGMAFTVNYHFK